MGARSVARVVVSFGLTQFGMKLFLSASGEQVSFNMISPKTGNRIKQKLVDAVTGEEIDRSTTLKGYEYQKDKYVTFTEEEVVNMAAEKKDTLDLKEFIPASEIDPLHVEKTFYTGPDKGFDRGYTILYEVLRKEKRAAVGTWVSRGKEHLVVISPYKHGLIMHQMYYNTEVRSFEDTCTKMVLTPVEEALSKVFVEHLSVDTFNKSKYSDKFVEKVTKAVQTKLAGGMINEVSTSVSNTNLADSMRESLLQMGVPVDKIDAMLAKALAETTPTPTAIPSEEPKPKAKGRRKAG